MELGLDFAIVSAMRIQTQLKIDFGLTAQLVLTLIKSGGGRRQEVVYE